MIQEKKKANINAGLGVAIRKNDTDVEPTDYVLLVEEKPSLSG
jgi:type I restriction enzyme R subunit